MNSIEAINGYAALLLFGFAMLLRLPFLRFPMDEDMGFWTYIAHFQKRSIKWKKDMFLTIPQWRMVFMNIVHGGGSNGLARLRFVMALFHAIAAIVLAQLALCFSGSQTAALITGLLYGFYGTSPSLYMTSFTQEQFYIPLLGISLISAMIGGAGIPISAIFMAFAFVAKFMTPIYIPLLAIPIWQYNGAADALLFLTIASTGVGLSFAADYLFGFMDEEGKAGLKVRLANAISVPNASRNRAKYIADLKKIVPRILPLLLFGLPTVAIGLSAEYWLWVAAMVIGGAVMMIGQQMLSRYHYTPLVAMLAVATGVAASTFLSSTDTASLALLITLCLMIAFSVAEQLPLFINATSTENLAKYTKWDQYLYLPRLGAAVKKLAAKSNSRSVFIWGCFVQLYQYIDKPAADKFLLYSVAPWDSKAKLGYFDTVVGGIAKEKPSHIVVTYHNLDMDFLGELTGLKYQLLHVAYCRYAVYKLTAVATKAANITAMTFEEKKSAMELLTAGSTAAGICRKDIDVGNIGRALRETAKALQINKADWQAEMIRIELLLKIGRGKEAVDLAKQTKTDVAKSVCGFLSVAQILISDGFSKEAKRLTELYEKRFGKDTHSLYLHGYIAEVGGKEESLQLYVASIAKDETNWMSLLHMATLHEKAGNKKVAAEATSKLLKIKSLPAAERLTAKVMFARMQGGAEEEIKTLKLLLANSPNSFPLKYQLASCEERVEANSRSYVKQLFIDIVSSKASDWYRGSASYRAAMLETKGDEKLKLLKLSTRLAPTHMAAAKELSLLAGGS